MKQAGAQGTAMWKSQILTGHVLGQEIGDALLAVDRTAFVPPSFKGAAYLDEELPLGEGRFLLAPLVFARFLKYADIPPSATVLDVAAGTGYGAMVLSRLAQRVVAVESHPGLLASARASVAGRSNIRLIEGPLAEGFPAEAPYDAIFIEGAIRHLPQALCDQLREGGSLVTVLQETKQGIALGGAGKIVCYRNVKGRLTPAFHHDASVPLLPDFEAPARFTF